MRYIVWIVLCKSDGLFECSKPYSSQQRWSTHSTVLHTVLTVAEQKAQLE